MSPPPDLALASDSSVSSAVCNQNSSRMMELKDSYWNEGRRSSNGGALKGTSEEKVAFRGINSGKMCGRCFEKKIPCILPKNLSAVKCVACSHVSGSNCSFIDAYLHWRAVNVLKISKSEWIQLSTLYPEIVSPSVLRNELRIQQKSSSSSPAPADEKPLNEAPESKTLANITSSDDTSPSVDPIVALLVRQICDLRKKNAQLEDLIKVASRNYPALQKELPEKNSVLESRQHLEASRDDRAISDPIVNTLRDRVKDLETTLVDCLLVQRKCERVVKDAIEKFESGVMSEVNFVSTLKSSLPDLGVMGKHRSGLMLDSDKHSSLPRKRARAEEEEEKGKDSDRDDDTVLVSPPLYRLKRTVDST